MINNIETVADIFLRTIETNAFLFGEIIDEFDEEIPENLIYCSISFKQRVLIELFTIKNFSNELMINMGAFDIKEIDREIKESEEKKQYWNNLSMDTLGEMINMVMGSVLMEFYGEYNATDLSIPQIMKKDKSEYLDLLGTTPFVNLLVEDEFPVVIFVRELK